MISFQIAVITLHLFTIINKLALSVVLFLQRQNKVFFRHIAFIVFAPVALFVSNLLSFQGIFEYGWLMILNLIFSSTMYFVALSFIHVVFNIQFFLKQRFFNILSALIYLPYIIALGLYLSMDQTERALFHESDFNLGNHYLFDFLNTSIFVWTIGLPVLMFVLISKVRKQESLFSKLKDLPIRISFALKLSYSLIISTLVVLIGYMSLSALYNELIVIPIVSNVQVFYILYVMLDSGIFKIHDKHRIVYSGLFKNFRYLEIRPTNSEFTQRIFAHLEDQKPYLKEDFSLKDLSEQIEVPLHVVSSSINNEMNESFPSLVKKYRSEELKKKLVDDQYKHLSIEGIGKLCGYKSRSVMYNHFKEVTGLTPAQYVKNAKIKVR